LIYHANCLESTEIINLYGYTKNPDTLNYMAVMKYANKGTLRRNLAKVIEMNWKQRLCILYKIISGLYEIHNQNLIHRDLHDGNILIYKGKEDKEKTVFISDFGLCQSVSFKKNEKAYGVLPFVAPEILRDKLYTQASDIYSFSMIMWEFTSGIPPFNDRAHDIQLSFSIYKGERPITSRESTPQCYLDLMEKCWNEDPLKRPSALEVKNIIGNWIFHPYGDTIYEELKSNIMEFINIPENNDFETHSLAIYTSRLLNYSESLKLNFNVFNID
jgi:serine/threonine protein kinase